MMQKPIWSNRPTLPVTGRVCGVYAEGGWLYFLLTRRAYGRHRAGHYLVTVCLEERFRSVQSYSDIEWGLLTNPNQATGLLPLRDDELVRKEE